MVPEPDSVTMTDCVVKLSKLLLIISIHTYDTLFKKLSCRISINDDEKIIIKTDIYEDTIIIIININTLLY